MEAKTGIHPEHQRLIYLSKDMEDRKTLVDYEGLESGANIFLVTRLLGGGADLSMITPVI